MTASEDPSALLTSMKAGDRRSLARLLSVAESEPRRFASIAEPLAAALAAREPRALRVGITGPGGAGKSTLVDALVRELRGANGKVAVLAFDPSSERSGGALLGDRIRLAQQADPGLFFRSVATRGAAGGVAHAGFDQLDLLELFGFEWILIEAVGAGQSEIEVAYAADLTLLCLPPESGDAVQALKAGVMEAADLFCVTKADLPGAAAAAATLQSVLELRTTTSRAEVPRVLEVSAVAGSGIRELQSRILERAEALRRSGDAERRRRDRLVRRVRHLILQEIETRLPPLLDEPLGPAGQDGSARASPHRLAREMLDRLLR